MFARHSELQNVLCLVTCDYDFARQKKDYICYFRRLTRSGLTHASTTHLQKLSVLVKGKAVPLQARWGPEDS